MNITIFMEVLPAAVVITISVNVQYGEESLGLLFHLKLIHNVLTLVFAF